MTNRMPRWPAYQLLWLVLTPFVHVLYLWMAIKHRSSRLYLQRLAWQLPNGNIDIWLHAASVGEINALAPLVQRLKNQHPQQTIVFSCNTPTGFSVMQNKFGAALQCRYLPVDKQGNMRRLLQRAHPRCFIIMETEIWPNLYRELGRQSVPLILVNARVSDKTLQAPPWIRRLYRDCLQFCDAILARSPRDCQGFVQLGAKQERCKTVGNIKFQLPALTLRVDLSKPLIERAYILIASTHADEEYQICKALLALKQVPLLVLAPRHPQRATQILRELNSLAASLLRQSSVPQRSKAQLPEPETRIYLADTLGELSGFIQHALFVIMGGSFIKLGGHNILEVAAAKKAVICGPYMQQFADETHALLEANGMAQCGDYSALARQVETWLEHPQQADRVGANAYACMLAQQHVLDDYVAALQPFLAASS